MNWPAVAAPDHMTSAASIEPGPKRPANSASGATTQEAVDALVCDILPRQGCWSEEGYLWLTDHGRRMVEFTDGRIEELPLPTYTHQAVLSFLHAAFRAWIKPRGGVAMFSGLRLRIREGKYREPDVLALLERTDSRCQDRYWLGADLVLEVVSPDDPARDLVEKRLDYAEAGIPEYWIVDPRNETVTVLVLTGDAYVEYASCKRGDNAASALLQGFAVDVAEVFDAPDEGG